VRYDRKGFQKSILEEIWTLILVAVIAGVVSGGLIGLATDHRLSSSTSSGSFSAQ